VTAAAKSYHHGNLRDALILAAAALIEQQGSLEFSITDAARYAGVSSAAPYRHFKDKEDLLRAVRDLAFMGLNARSLATQHAHRHSDSIDRIIALGHTYLDYAREKHSFFSLMWEDRGDMAERKQNVALKPSGFAVLETAVAQYLAECPHTSMEVVDLATQLWATSHGIATLEANRMLDHFDPAAGARQLLTSSIRALLNGIRLG